MPADREPGVDERLRLLRSDVDQVAWSDGGAVRRRGEQRSRRRAFVGAAATVAVLAVAGFGVFAPSRLADDNVAGTPLEPPTDRTVTTSVPGSPDDNPGRSTAEPPTSPQAPDDRESGRDDPTVPQQPGDTGTSPLDGPPADTSPPSGDETSSPDVSPSPDDPLPSDEASIEARNAFTLVLAATEMPEVNDSGSTWRVANSSGDEGGTAAACQTQTLTSLGAATTSRRDYDWGEAGSAVTGVNTVGVFGAADDAQAAYDEISAALTSGCDWGTPSRGPTAVSVSEGSAQWWLTGDGQNTEAAGLVLRGTAVSIVVTTQPGQEFHGTLDATLTASWERLGTA